MKSSKSGSLMALSAVELTDSEMETITGGVIVPWTRMVPRISLGANLIATNNVAGAVSLLNQTFANVNWSRERAGQQRQFNTFLARNPNLKPTLQSLWTAGGAQLISGGLNTNVKDMIVAGLNP
ncbi:MAG: hypothetical protein HC908_13355 [Calothrix sp. SM1_7_51]|nr:hypothetical protein [Calothrix sp. SM1_7_51]